MKVRHYRAAEAQLLVPRFLDLYADVYQVPPYLGDPFFTVESYAGRLNGALNLPGFEIVTAVEARVLIGTGHGVTLPPAVAWWRTLLPALPDEVRQAAEQDRIFWLRELMVREP